MRGSPPAFPGSWGGGYAARLLVVNTAFKVGSNDNTSIMDILPQNDFDAKSQGYHFPVMDVDVNVPGKLAEIMQRR